MFTLINKYEILIFISYRYRCYTVSYIIVIINIVLQTLPFTHLFPTSDKYEQRTGVRDLLHGKQVISSRSGHQDIRDLYTSRGRLR